MTDQYHRLYRWTPAEIAAMSLDEARAVIDFHAANPPTMDYMKEYSDSLAEIKLARQRINQLKSEENR